MILTPICPSANLLTWEEMMTGEEKKVIAGRVSQLVLYIRPSCKDMTAFAADVEQFLETGVGRLAAD